VIQVTLKVSKAYVPDIHLVVYSSKYKVAAQQQQPGIDAIILPLLASCRCWRYHCLD